MMKKDDWDVNLDFSNYGDVQDKWWKVESPSSFALTFLAIASVIGCGWYFFGPDQDGSGPLPVPLIQAEAGPSKIRPENAGETNIPHQDKLVYNRLNPDENTSDNPRNIERLLPPPETPVIPNQQARTDGQTPTIDPNKPVVMAEDDMAGDARENHTFPGFSPPPAAEKEGIQPQGAKIEGIPGESQPVLNEDHLAVQEKKPAATVLSQSVEKVEKNARGGFRIQIASLPSPDLAKREWMRLQKSYAPVLSNQTPHFVRVDLGARKGVYHRIQIGHFKTRQDAQSLSRQLTQAGLACLVVPN